MMERNIGKNQLRARRMHKAQGAESNLSFIQLANEARETDTKGGLMEEKNSSQQAVLTQDFPSAAPVSPLLFWGKLLFRTLSLTLSGGFLSGREITETEGGTRSIKREDRLTAAGNGSCLSQHYRSLDFRRSQAKTSQANVFQSPGYTPVAGISVSPEKRTKICQSGFCLYQSAGTGGGCRGAGRLSEGGVDIFLAGKCHNAALEGEGKT